MQLLGPWYVHRKLKGSGRWNSGIAEIERVTPNDVMANDEAGDVTRIRILYCAAVQGQCRPTQVLVLKPVAGDYSEWESSLPSGSGL